MISSFAAGIGTLATRAPRWRALVLTLAASVLTACGGGGSGGSGNPGGGLPFPKFNLTVSKSGTGTVTSQPQGIACGSTCAFAFDEGITITLTATPAAGQSFAGWGGACSGAGTTCQVQMTSNQAVSARFQAPPATNATLTASVAGNGTVTSQPAGISCGATCSASYALDTVVTLSAVPATGNVFAAWGGACTGAGETCTVTMAQSHTVTASFNQAPAVQRSLGVAVTGTGLVRSQPAGIDCGSTCSARFGDGASVLLTATPGTGQRFAGWTGSCSGTASTCTVAMSQDLSVGATFAAAASAPVWQAPLLVEQSNDFDVQTRVLTAIGPAGHAMVIWEQSDGTPSGTARKAWSRRYTADQGWGPAVAVPGVTTVSTLDKLVEGAVLIDNSGTATWIRPNMETRRSTVAAGWGTAFAPTTVSSGLLSSATLAADGTVHAVISGRDVYHNTLPPSSSWQGWTRLDASGSLDAREAAIALSSNGTAVAVWREKNPGDANYSLKAARRVSAAAGWQAPQTIDSSFDSVIADSPPRVVLDAAGNAIAVWHQGESLYYNVFSAAGSWGTATEVDAGQVNSLFPARIQLATTAAGRAVVTWRSNIYAMKAMQFTPGAGFSAPTLVTAYSGDPSLGLDADGNAVVVYFAPNQWPNPTTGSDVYTRRLTWGTGWSQQSAIEPVDGLGANLTSSFNASGQGVAAWVRPDTSGSSSRQSLWVSVLR